MESTGVKPHNYSQLIFDKVLRIPVEEGSGSINGTGETRRPYVKNEIRPLILPAYKNQLKSGCET
jgi:hypothetical protein